jgi:hypothetical protein
MGDVLFEMFLPKTSDAVFCSASTGIRYAMVDFCGRAYRWLPSGDRTMILKLTTNNKASIWVNLSRILQMTMINAEDGYPKTQIVMDNGAVIVVFEMPDDIAERTKNR